MVKDNMIVKMTTDKFFWNRICCKILGIDEDYLKG